MAPVRPTTHQLHFGRAWWIGIGKTQACSTPQIDREGKTMKKTLLAAATLSALMASGMTNFGDVSN